MLFLLLHILILNFSNQIIFLIISMPIYISYIHIETIYISTIEIIVPLDLTLQLTFPFQFYIHPE